MADKKEEKKPSSGDGWDNPEVKALMWVIAVIIFLSFFLRNFDGKLFEQSPQPVEDEVSGRVVEMDEGIRFPIGEIQRGDEVILKENIFVRGRPAQAILGKQKKYSIAQVQEGPFTAYGQQWWRLNFKEAPDGWVPEHAFTKHVGTYRSVHILPITWKYIKPFLWLAGLILMILYFAMKLRLNGLREEAKSKLYPQNKSVEQIPSSVPHIVVGDKEAEELFTAGDRRSNDRWMHIVQLLQSHNQNDWRQAIIEADIILEEMLEKMGYDGVTIGDKLKNVEPADFRTLNQAWEAHKTRNRIAHMGSEFQISHREAERVINLYQEVFDEFYYI